MIQASGGTRGYAPKVVVDTQGTATVVWSERSGIWFNRFTQQVGWGYATEITTRTSRNQSFRFPQVAVDYSGIIVTTWLQRPDPFTDGVNDVWANRYVPGTGWGRAELLENNSVDVNLVRQLAANGNGHAVALWDHESPDGRSTIWTSHLTPSGGWNWHSTTSIGTSGSGDSDVALDPEGNAMAVWVGRRRGVASIWARRFVPSSGWDAPTDLHPDGDLSAFHPRVAVDAEGNAIVVWAEYSGETTRLWANRFERAAGWGTATQIHRDGDPTFTDPGQAQVALDGDGNAVAVWAQERSAIWANRFTKGVGWGVPTAVKRLGIGLAEYVDLAVAEDGRAVIVWMELAGTRGSVWASSLR